MRMKKNCRTSLASLSWVDVEASRWTSPRLNWRRHCYRCCLCRHRRHRRRRRCHDEFLLLCRHILSELEARSSDGLTVALQCKRVTHPLTASLKVSFKWLFSSLTASPSSPAAWRPQTSKCCAAGARKTARGTWSPHKTLPPGSPCTRRTRNPANSSPGSCRSKPEWWVRPDYFNSRPGFSRPCLKSTIIPKTISEK